MPLGNANPIPSATGLCVNKCIDAHDVAVGIHQRATTVAGLMAASVWM
jgi:hypothetical protein